MVTPVLDPEVRSAAASLPPIELRADALAKLRVTQLELFTRFAPPLSNTVERVDHVVREDPRIVVRVHRPAQLRAPARRWARAVNEWLEPRLSA